jgi:DNA-binding transcriptional LysR family regulator
MQLMDLHKCQIFYTVARMQSFTRAAQALNMTQPTVSQQVATLEASLNVELLERSTRHLRLTEAGEVLYRYTEQLITLSSEALEAVQTAAGLAVQTLKLGVGHTLATYLLPGTLHRYRSQYPDDHVRLSVGNTGELLEQLASGVIDIALVGSPAEHVEIITEPFMRDRLVVIVGADDLWSGRKSATLDDLRKRLLLTREPGSALYRTIAQLMGESYLASEDVMLLGETEAIKRSVELGLGVALIQGIAIEREVEAGTLSALSLIEADDSRTYLIATRKRANLNAAAERFITVLRETTEMEDQA